MTAPNFDVTAHELGIARREILKVRAERDALQARLDEQTERADMWDNEAHQGYEINGDLRARVEELENIDRIGDLEDSLGRALAEANQLEARVEELEALVAQAAGVLRDEAASLDRKARVLRSDRKEQE